MYTCSALIGARQYGTEMEQSGFSPKYFTQNKIKIEFILYLYLIHNFPSEAPKNCWV